MFLAFWFILSSFRPILVLFRDLRLFLHLVLTFQTFMTLFEPLYHFLTNSRLPWNFFRWYIYQAFWPILLHFGPFWDKFSPFLNFRPLFCPFSTFATSFKSLLPYLDLLNHFYPLFESLWIFYDDPFIKLLPHLVNFISF